MSIFKNIKEPITTLLGALVIIASLASVFVADFDWSQATIGIAAGVGLLFMKDGKGSGGKAVMLVLMPLLFFGCNSQKAVKAPQIITVHDSTWITQESRTDTTYLPGETLTRWIPYDCDSLGKLTINKAFVNKAKCKRSERLKVEVDSERKLLYVAADCDSLIQVNSSLTTEVNTLRNRVILPPMAIATDAKAFWEIVVEVLYYLLAFLAGVGLGRLIN